MRRSSERAISCEVCALVFCALSLGCGSDLVPIGFDPVALNGAGAGGDNGSGGSGGAGGQAVACFPPAPWPKGSGSELLIDDFSDNDLKIPSLDLRNGEWSIATDSSLMGAHYSPKPLVPTNGELHVDAALYGAALPAGGYGWGAAISVFLNANCPYDAANYAGISFRAKGTISQQLWVQVAIPEVIPRSQTGGACPASAAEEATLCNNKHHKVYQAADLTSEYQTFTVLWSELKQGSWGYRPPVFTPNVISYIEFAFPQLAEKTTPAADARHVDFNITIDDVKFMPLE